MNYDIIIATALFSGIFIYGAIGIIFWRRYSKLDEDWDALKRSDPKRMRDKS